MDFDFAPEENSFREELRTWLPENAPRLLSDGPQYSDPALPQTDPHWRRDLVPRLSEPGAGSVVASLTTCAEDRGDYFVVNGQRVWTTLAHRAHFCMLVNSPGVTVRPLVQMTRNHEFNEVFFEDVEL